MRVFSVLILLLILYSSCQVVKQRHKRKAVQHEFYGDVKGDCFDKWKYQELMTGGKIRVLFFSPYRSSLYERRQIVEPNWIIGIDANNDTIAVVDLSFRGSLKENEFVSVLPKVWTDEEKRMYKPGFVLFYKMKYREYLCAVKVAYYGEFSIAQ